MEIKICFSELQLNNTPLERMVFDSNCVGDQYILLDDVNEKRWKVKFKSFLALRITPMEYSNLNFFKGGDFPDECFEEKKGFPVPQFRSHIMEVRNSKWIKALKKSVRKDSENAEYMKLARHFLILGYDNIIEIVAWGIELAEVKE